MANLSWFSLVFLLFFKISQPTYGYAKGLSFRLILSDSINSSMHQVNHTTQQKIERLFHQTDARAESLKPLFQNNYSISRVINPDYIRPPLHHQSNNYLFLIQVGIGTFYDYPNYKTYYLVFDTASGPIWTQCEGCNPCFHQRYPVFPRSQSSSYHEFTCQNCPPGATCEQNRCVYGITYGPNEQNTHVRGIVAKETFTFGSTVGSPMPIWNLGFGCVFYTQNFVHGMDDDNIVSGVFGMGPEPSSFMGQLGSHFGGRFSYCLTPMISQQSHQPPQMFLRFGDDIPSLHRHYRTPLIRGHFRLYYLDLQAISVGSNYLVINKRVFQFRQDGTGGCIIDAGAGTTLLIKDAYIELKEVLTRKILGKNPGVSVSTDGHRGLCYRGVRQEFNKFPKLTFHFANDADLVVEPRLYITEHYENSSRYNCLLIRPSNTFTLIGAYQQANHRVIYDTVNSELQFAPTDCLSGN